MCVQFVKYRCMKKVFHCSNSYISSCSPLFTLEMWINSTALLIDFWCSTRNRDTDRSRHVSLYYQQVWRADLPLDWNTCEAPGVSNRLQHVSLLHRWACTVCTVSWRSAPDSPAACSATTPHYWCISQGPLLNEHWDKASGEWTVWLHRREAWAPRSNVPLKYLSAL